MTHPRLIAANGHVAHISLKGLVSAETYVEGRLMQVIRPVVDLLRKPGGGLDCQLLCGSRFLVLEDLDGYFFGQHQRDGYVGYITTDALGPITEITHRVCARSTHVYPDPDMKTRPLEALPFGARISVIGEQSGFFKLSRGYVPTQHACPVSKPSADPVEVVESFLGIPYLWGGNSVWGMDCSGAVQLALDACDIECPRDTDMQEAALGRSLAPDEPLLRGDIVFWKGHVGMMRDPVTVIHANAHHMAVASEPLAVARTRIEQAGGGPVTSIRRL